MSPSLRVLVVDDEPDILAIARAALEFGGGVAVEACGSGLDALRRAEASPPDVVLLDVMMPGLDGPSTLRQLREKPATSGVPVVFMTAKVQPDELRRYQASGALAVIRKPFDPLSLGRELRNLLGRNA